MEELRLRCAHIWLESTATRQLMHKSIRAPTWSPEFPDKHKLGVENRVTACKRQDARDVRPADQHFIRLVAPLGCHVHVRVHRPEEHMRLA
eukprot:SAG11_NODE_3707_length_2267_cov_2.191421_1_plen_90_part_10